MIRRSRVRRAVGVAVFGLILTATWMHYSGKSREELLRAVQALEGRRGTLEEVRRLLGEPDHAHLSTTEAYSQYSWHLGHTTLAGEEVVTLYVDVDATGYVVNTLELTRDFHGADAWRLRWLRLLHCLRPSEEYDEFVCSRAFSF